MFTKNAISEASNSNNELSISLNVISNTFCYDKSYVHSKLQFFFAQADKGNSDVLSHLNQTKKITVTSTFVTDVGNQICW